MKNSFILKIIFLIFLVSSTTQAAYDMNQLSSLNGKTGTGQNPYEKGDFECSISVDKDSNSIEVRQSGSYSFGTVFLGNLVETVEQSDTKTVLTTLSTTLSNSSLCGDYLKVRDLTETLVVTKNSVSVTGTYHCGFFKKRHRDTYTCNFK